MTSGRKTTLIVLRGPSGSGKSSVAGEIRARREDPMAIIEQDYFRRTVLKEKDVPGALNIDLIKAAVLMALDNSYDVVLEGIFDAGRYEKMFEDILRSHPSNNHFFYFDIPFEETLARHKFRPDKSDFGEVEMRRWYKEGDFLHCLKEAVIPEVSSLENTVNLILSASTSLKEE